MNYEEYSLASGEIKVSSGNFKTRHRYYAVAWNRGEQKIAFRLSKYVIKAWDIWIRWWRRPRYRSVRSLRDYGRSLNVFWGSGRARWLFWYMMRPLLLSGVARRVSALIEADREEIATFELKNQSQYVVCSKLIVYFQVYYRLVRRYRAWFNNTRLPFYLLSTS